MKFKAGFTIIELLIVVVMVAVLAALVLPRFGTTMEQARANEAVSYLRMIRAGERAFLSRNNTYILIAAGPAARAAIQANLGVDVSETNFTFSVGAGAAGIATSFVATATRTNGAQAGNTISIDQNGAIAGPAFAAAGINIPGN
jgi:type IV pilus assembly protein PilE